MLRLIPPLLALFLTGSAAAALDPDGLGLGIAGGRSEAADLSASQTAVSLPRPGAGAAPVPTGGSDAMPVAEAGQQPRRAMRSAADLVGRLIHAADGQPLGVITSATSTGRGTVLSVRLLEPPDGSAPTAQIRLPEPASGEILKLNVSYRQFLGQL